MVGPRKHDGAHEGAQKPTRICFPDASSVLAAPNGKQGPASAGPPKFLTLLEKNGAGEAIRTPDPNLGKVVLYP